MFDLEDDVSGWPDEIIGADEEDDDDFLGIFGDDDDDDDDDVGYDDDDDDDIAGDDDDDDDDVGYDFVGDFVGARRRRSKRGRRARARRKRRILALRAAKRSGRRSAVKRRRTRGLTRRAKPATAGRQIFFGANSAGSGAQLILQATVQEICRPVRMVLEVFVTADGTSINLGSVLVADIKVGTKSQFTALQAIPGSIFRADATAMSQGFLPDTIQPGTNYAVILAATAALNTYAFAVTCRTLR